MPNSRVPERELSVAIFVRERRKAGGLTQIQLGELAGVGKRFIVELEAGKPTLRMDKVNQVLAVFGRYLGPVPTTTVTETAPEPPGEEAVL